MPTIALLDINTLGLVALRQENLFVFGAFLLNFDVENFWSTLILFAKSDV